MNDWNQLENQLHSWIPRRPSGSLKARLFAAPLTGTAIPAQALIPMPLTLRWLAPALAVLVLALVLWNPAPQALTQFISSPPISMVATVSLSDAHLAAYCDASTHSGYNALSGATFEWTNGSLSLTTAVPVFNTNSLMP